MSKKYPCVELTIDLKVGKDTWRFWIDCEGKLPGIEDAYKLDEVQDRIFEVLKEGGTPVEIHAKMAEIPRVNAVQMTREMGQGLTHGTIVYTVKF